MEIYSGFKLTELRRHVVVALTPGNSIPGSAEPVEEEEQTGTQIKAVNIENQRSRKADDCMTVLDAVLLVAFLCYVISLPVFSSIGIWLATDDDHNCRFVNITNATYHNPIIKTTELAVAGLGCLCLVLVIVLVILFVHVDKVSEQVGSVMLVLVALVMLAYTSLQIYGIVLAINELQNGTCGDKIVAFMVSSGLISGLITIFMTITLVVWTVRKSEHES